MMAFAEMREMADEIAKSGCFKAGYNPMTPQQVMVLMMLARARGFAMIEGVMRYDIIENVPAMKAKCLLAEFQAAGGQIEWLETNDKVCRATFRHPVLHPDPFLVDLTFDDFERKGVVYGKDGKVKSNWHRWPAAMLRARAESEGINAIMPGVAMGIPMADEIEVIESEPVRDPAISRLNEQLRRRLPAPPVPAIEPPLADSGPPESTDPANEPKSAKPTKTAPTTEFGRFIQGQIDKYESELAKLAKDHTEMDYSKDHVALEQVVNHVAKSIVGEANYAMLQTNGKHDKNKVRTLMIDKWESDQDFISDETKDYLEAKLSALRPAEVGAEFDDPER
jgi:hypothetical protein